MAINKSKFWDEALETAPREVLEANQLKDLQEIVKFAYDNSPYYKRSFDEAGVKPSDIKTLKDFTKKRSELIASLMSSISVSS